MTKDIFFRGDIDFCNYSCSYCPFAKKTQSIDKIQKEEDNLKKLFFYLKNMDEDANIMITPYGEALIHPIYQVFIARLSTLDNVRKIGIQTNLSVDTKNLISTLEENKAYFSKIMIWATFHSQFTDIKQFCNKANQLSKLISISCGIVANRKNFEEIKNLRQGLRPDVYLWINAMDKIKNKFTEDEISYLSHIDPFFAYEFYEKRIDFTKSRSDDFSICQSYDKIYADSYKYSSSCFFKKKKAISSSCNNHKICDCYLGYSNFKDNYLSRFFGENAIFRIPQKKKFDAVFVDIDGVMTEKNGKLINNLQIILEDLSKKTNLYIATSRNVNSAKKLLSKNIDFFNGGVFSDGCYIVDFEKNTKKIIPLGQSINTIYFEETILDIINIFSKKDKVIDLCKSNQNLNINKQIKKNVSPYTSHNLEMCKLKKDMYDNNILRIALPTKIAKNIEISKHKRRIYNNTTFFQNELASKLTGIKEICKLNNYDLNNILVISDNIQDEDIFDNIRYSVTPLHQLKLYKKSRYILNLCHLTFIIE